MDEKSKSESLEKVKDKLSQEIEKLCREAEKELEALKGEA